MKLEILSALGMWRSLLTFFTSCEKIQRYNHNFPQAIWCYTSMNSLMLMHVLIVKKSVLFDNSSWLQAMNIINVRTNSISR